MTMNLSARAAYDGATSRERPARQVEYEVFARVTRQMKQANAAPADDMPGFARAVHDNMRLWRVLSADVSRPENGLPRELRARLTYLGEFTRLHSRKALKGAADLSALIDINTAIMRGLRGEGARQ